MAVNPNDLQQLLTNLQTQIATVSSMAGQLSSNPVAPIAPALQQVGMNNGQDLAAFVKSTVAAELLRLTPSPITAAPTLSQGQQAPQLQQVQQPTQQTPQMQQAVSTQDLVNPPPVLAAPVAAVPIAAPVPVPVTTPVPEITTMTPQPNIQDMMMKNLMNELKAAIGGGLTGDQQVFISSNLFGLPGFLRSDVGRAHIQEMLASYKKSTEA